jgi:hypothetical protein
VVVNLHILNQPHLKQYAANVGEIVVMDNKQEWACADCGATTTDPDHRLIVFFHMNCPARSK